MESKRQCWWTYSQGSSGDADIDERPVDPVGEGEGEMDGECSIETHTSSYVS